MNKIYQTGAVTTAEFEAGKSGNEFHILLMSDWHYDSLYCNRELLNTHIKLLDEPNTYAIVAGDIFDAMQGKFDPRRTYNDLRPEYKVADYYDAIVNDVREFVRPYCKKILVLGKGQHDLGALTHANTDLISRVLEGLPDKVTQIGYFSGFVKLIFAYSKTSKRRYTIYYSHGGGTNSPVTRGTIQTNRQAVYLPDADVVHNGHNHQGYILPIQRARLAEDNSIKTDTQWHVRTPGYKTGTFVGDSWEAQKAFGPNPNGSVILNLVLSTHGSERRITTTATTLIE